MDPRKGEFIGQQVEVTASTDPSLIGLSGRVVDETMNTFVIRADRKDRRVAKAASRFRFGEGAEIAGDEVAFRPEDRIKKVR